MKNYSEERQRMVADQVAARGVTSEAVLSAMSRVPRERFLPPEQAAYAYHDSPLPIAAGQTISQPYIVAIMAEALGVGPGSRVLEIGAGSGYAAAVLAEMGCEVYTIERIGELASSARAALEALDYDAVHLRHGDGTLGWPEEAPFDGIVVAAGAPAVPEALKQQLRVSGRLVIPVGSRLDYQELMRVTRVAPRRFETEDLTPVRFVPLLGEQGWQEPGVPPPKRQASQRPPADSELRTLIADACEPFQSVDTANLDPVIGRIGDARLVLIGEASHGTSEFYRLRARLTRALVEQKGFDFVAIEGDWPDAARIDHYVRHFEYPATEWTAFARFPTWMWRNQETRVFVDWLRQFNRHRSPQDRAAFHGLDLYSLYASIRAVLKYLEDVDPEVAALARERYACLTMWQPDPATYARAALQGMLDNCEKEVLAMLVGLAEKRLDYTASDGERYLEVLQNARLIAAAEEYYRTMYYGSRSSWNLRDGYMFDTLERLLEHHGPESKAVVWAHNSHVGDAGATSMSDRGETNIGELCRKSFGDDVYVIGFGTDFGTVAAASEWDGPMEIKTVQPSRAGSYERLFHEVGLPGLFLPLRALPESNRLRAGLEVERLERAIGVIYRPETELASHYFEACLPKQFDEYVWIDETRAIRPFRTAELEDFPDTYPFGL